MSRRLLAVVAIAVALTLGWALGSLSMIVWAATHFRQVPLDG